jgi:virulence factor Mce-like protein
MLTLGAVGIGFALLLLYIGFTAPERIPGRSYYNLTAQFNDADNLTKSYQVRIGGRLVGQVLDPRVQDGKGVVRLQLTPDIEPLKSDTTLRVRPRSAVGVRFLELTPGTKGEPLREGDVIPAGQTSETVQLDEALGTFDAARRAKLKTFISELGGGVVSRGEDLNDTVRTAPDFLGDLAAVSRAVNARRGAPARFVQESQGAAAAADPVRDVIGRGFRPEADALKVFTDNEARLRKLLDVAPADLSGVRAGLSQTDPFLTETRAFAAAARPALRAGVPALREAAALFAEARPGLRDLDPTLQRAQQAVSPTLAVLDTLKPVLPNIRQALTEPQGILSVLAPRGCDITGMARNWTSMLGFGSGNGTNLRFSLIPSLEGGIRTTEASKPLVAKTLSPTGENAYPAPCVAGTEQR